MFLFEKPEAGGDLFCLAAHPLRGQFFPAGVGYTLQVIGQKKMDPTVASLILSLESVISVLAGWVLLGQRLAGREILGCVVMFAAIILAQLPDKTVMRKSLSPGRGQSFSDIFTKKAAKKVEKYTGFFLVDL